MDLATKKCTPCHGDVLPLSHDTALELLENLSEWNLFDTYIQKTYRFNDFKGAVRFVNDVATIAEGEGHHPDITITYNIVTLTLTTHAINGLSENDFILAAKIDRYTPLAYSDTSRYDSHTNGLLH